MKKNYWPMAIVGIILFGVVVITAGVIVAIKHPAIDEEMYGGKKRDIDEHINIIFQEQREFESSAKVILHTGSDQITLQTPYLNKAPQKSQTQPKLTLPMHLEVLADFSLHIHGVDLTITSFIPDVPDSAPIALLGDDLDYTESATKIEQAFPKTGRYKLKIRIHYSTKSDSQNLDSTNAQSSAQKSAYFEQEVFYTAGDSVSNTAK